MTDANMWHLVIGGQVQGPMGAEDVISKLKDGSIDGSTLAHAHGVTENWTPVEQIQQFSHVIGGQDTLPPVPTSRGIGKPASDEVDYEIFGDALQFVEIELDPGESVVSEAGAMMYMDQFIQMETIFGDGSTKKQDEGWWGMIKDAGKRVLTGESLFMTVFKSQARSGKSKVAFAAPYPGKILVVDLKDIGGTLICQKESFLCGAKGVAVGIAFQKKFGVGLFGGEGFIMQKLDGDGLVFCHAGGTIVGKDLQPNETLKIDTGCIVGYQPSVNFDIQMVGGVKSALFGGEGIFLATLTGPGKIWLQSLPFSRFASRIYAAARQTGGHKEEGSVLGSIFNSVSGD